jgi:hypothetical protein
MSIELQINTDSEGILGVLRTFASHRHHHNEDVHSHYDVATVCRQLLHRDVGVRDLFMEVSDVSISSATLCLQSAIQEFPSSVESGVYSQMPERMEW